MAINFRSNTIIRNLSIGPLSGGGNGGGGGGYSLPIESSGLQLFWDMGESTSYSGTGTTINDLSGNGNHGTLTGTPTWNSNGASSYFDWSADNDSYVRYTTSTGTDDLNIDGGSTITVSNWLTFTDGTSGQETYIASQQSTKGQLWLRQGMDGHASVGDKLNGTLGLNVSTVSTAYTHTADWANFSEYGLSSSDAGTWFNMTYTVGSGNWKFYLNGVLQWTDSINSAGTFEDYQFIFGTQFMASGAQATWSTYSGKWGNSAVYNTELSATQVLSNYNALKSRYGY